MKGGHTSQFEESVGTPKGFSYNLQKSGVPGLLSATPERRWQPSKEAPVATHAAVTLHAQRYFYCVGRFSAGCCLPIRAGNPQMLNRRYWAGGGPID